MAFGVAVTADDLALLGAFFGEMARAAAVEALPGRSTTTASTLARFRALTGTVAFLAAIVTASTASTASLTGVGAVPRHVTLFATIVTSSSPTATSTAALSRFGTVSGHMPLLVAVEASPAATSALARLRTLTGTVAFLTAVVTGSAALLRFGAVTGTMTFLATIMATIASRAIRVGGVSTESPGVGGGKGVVGGQPGRGCVLLVFESPLGFAVLLACSMRVPVFCLDGPLAGLAFRPDGADDFVRGVRIRLEDGVESHHGGFTSDWHFSEMIE